MRFQYQLIFLVAALFIGCEESVIPTEPDTPLDPDTEIGSDTPSDVALSPDGSTLIPPKEDVSITIVEATGEIEHLPAGEELPANLVKTFNCLPKQVGDEMVMAKVKGQDGDQIVIRPSGTEACHYDLIYRSVDGAEHVLSGTDPSGYLFTITQQSAGDLILVCVNNIQHHPLDGAVHEIDEVAIDCAARVNGAWTPLQAVVTPDGPWAAWIRSITPDEFDFNRFRVTFAHDFSYQFMNLTDNGRPEDDGLYEVVLDVTSDGIKTNEEAIVAETLNPLAGGQFSGWNPTPQEEIDYAEFMTMGDGPCPNGCPIEEEEEENP